MKTAATIARICRAWRHPFRRMRTCSSPVRRPFPLYAGYDAILQYVLGRPHRVPQGAIIGGSRDASRVGGVGKQSARGRRTCMVGHLTGQANGPVLATGHDRDPSHEVASEMLCQQFACIRSRIDRIQDGPAGVGVARPLGGAR